MPVYQSKIHNVEPYYDDFSEDKKFLRMLFRPGFAVQARELTQLQTVIQNQVERFGSHVFENGSVVAGGNISESDVSFLRVKEDSTLDLTKVIGYQISDSNITAKVIHAIEGTTTDPHKILFFEYITGGGVGVTAFTAGETGVASSIATETLTFDITDSATHMNVGDSVILFTIDEGVFFSDGYFIKTDLQHLPLFKTTDVTGTRDFATPTVSVGFDVNRTIVSSDTDSSLLDASFGTSNFNAPGADRYKIELLLKQLNFDNTETNAIANFNTTDYFELARVILGRTHKKIKYPDYAKIEETLARRTFDESGNYTVRPFTLDVREHTAVFSGGSADHLAIGLEPGKAFVHGFEFETQQTEYVAVEKARGTSHTKTTTQDTTIDVGNYLLMGLTSGAGAGASAGDYLSGLLPNSAVVLKDSSNTTLGSARVRQVVQHNTSTNPKTFKVFLSEITGVSDNKNIYAVESGGNRLFEVDATAGGGTISNTVLFSPEKNSYLFRVPVGDTVKSFDETNHQITLPITITTGSNSSVVVTAGEHLEEADETVGAASPYIQFMGDPSPAFVSPGDITDHYLIIDADGNLLTDSATTNIQVVNNPGSGQCTISFTDSAGASSHSSETMTMIATMKITQNGSDATPTWHRKKVLREAWKNALTSSHFTNSEYVELLHSDVFRITAVTDATGANICANFVLDDGQRDNRYDWGRAYFRPTAAIPDIASINYPILITYDYFLHEGRGPCIADSYNSTHLQSFDWITEIPNYISRSTGEVFPLADVVDYRPARRPSSAWTGAPVVATNEKYLPTWVPRFNTALTGKYNFYIPRIDKIALMKDRTFKVLKGTPGVVPIAPANPQEGMVLYQIRVNPYTFSTDDIEVKFIENKRYTMRDIATLENRVEALEYYTNLSLLERQSEATTIKDSAGLEQFRNGLLVDSFNGHNIGDVSLRDYNCAVDFVTGELRPPFVSGNMSMRGYTSGIPTGASGATSEDIELTYTSGFAPTNDNILMLPLDGVTSNEIFIDQPFASHSEKVNPLGSIHWLGHVRLSPSSDDWYYDLSKPEVLVNKEGENNSWLQDDQAYQPGRLKGWGTHWNWWETNWTGKQQSLPKDPRSGRPIINKVSGCSAKKEPTQKRNFIDLKSREGVEQKIVPDRIFQKINDRIVDKSIIPKARQKIIVATVSGLKPNTRVYPFFDGSDVSASTTSTSSFITDSDGAITLTFTMAANTYKAGDRIFRVTDSPTDNVSATTTAAEAIFTIKGLLPTISNGVVSTRQPIYRRDSIHDNRVVQDAFARTQQDTDQAISSHVDPFSQTFIVDPSSFPEGLFIHSVDLFFKSKDASIPITLQINPTENGNPNTNFVVPLAEKTILPASITTSAGPGATTGLTNVVFDTPIYLPSGKHTLSLITNSDKYEVFVAKIGDKALDSSGAETTNQILPQLLTGQLFRPRNTGDARGDNQNKIMFRLRRARFVTNEVKTLVADDSRGNAYTNTAAFKMDVGQILANDLDFPTTSLTYSLETTNLGESTLQGAITILPNENIFFEKTQTVKINDTSVSYRLTVSFSTPSNILSPVLDLDRFSLLATNNLINANSIVSTNGELGAESTLPIPVDFDTYTGAQARYITKRVKLEPGFESDDIQVILNATKPKSSAGDLAEIHVFVKTLASNQTDMFDFDEQVYVQLKTDKQSAGTEEQTANDNDFQEFVYKLQSGSFTEFNVFAIKIVMYGTSATFPRIKDLRVIASSKN